MAAALVTGAGRGIGKAIAEVLAKQGFDLALVARSEAELQGVKEHIQRSSSVQVAIVVGDVGEQETLQRAVQLAERDLGPLEVLVNNAGKYQTGSAELSHQEFDELVRVNLRGAFNGVHEVVPLMKKRRKGYIMNVSSMCGIQGFAGIGAYCATKHALQGLNESLYRELVPLGLRVTALLPSWVATQMSASAPIADGAKIQPSDLGKAVQFLLSLSPGACVKELVIDCSATPV